MFTATFVATVAMTTTRVASFRISSIWPLAFFMLNSIVFYYSIMRSSSCRARVILCMHGMFFYFIIFGFAAIAYHYLIMTTAVRYIFSTVNIMANPWVSIVYHDFVAMVEIKISIARWQCRPAYPCAAIKIHKYMAGNIIISISIGQVILIHMIISYRAPDRLGANIHRNA